MSTRKLFGNALGLVVLGAIGAVYYAHAKSWESSEAAYTSWHNRGTPGEIRVVVRDRAGNPVRGATVSISNNSGGDGGPPTDAAGVTVIRPGEADVEAMWINGHQIIDRPYAYHLGSPEMGPNGLVVDVQMKW